MRSLAVLILFALVLAAGFWGLNTHLGLQKWALAQITQQVQKQLPLRLQAESVALTLLPPGARMQNIHIQSTQKQFQNFRLKQASLELQILPLFTGRVKIKKLAIQGARLQSGLIPTQMRAHPSNSTAPLRPVTPFRPMAMLNEKRIIQRLNKVPFQTVELKDIQVVAEAKPFYAQMDILFLSLNWNKKDIRIQMDSNNISLSRHYDFAPYHTLSLGVRMEALLSNNQLHVNTLHATKDSSYINVAAVLQHGGWKIQAHNSLIKAIDFNEGMQKLFAHHKLPLIQGEAQLSFNMQQQNSKALQMQFHSQFDSLGVGKYRIGHIDIKGRKHKNLWQVEKLLLHSQTGRAQVRGLVFDSYAQQIKGQLDIERLNFQLFLQNLGLLRVPVQLQLQGRVQCEGPVQPLALKCGADLAKKDIQIRNRYTRGRQIVKVKSLLSKGDVWVNAQQVRYKATQVLINNNSQAVSSGTIDYKTGFRIHYAGRADFNEIGPIGAAVLEGTSYINGLVHGNARSARVQATAQGQNIWLNDFFLGNVNTRLRYRRAHLHLQNLKGVLNKSHYTAEVDLDLAQARVVSLSALSPTLRAQDLLQALERQTKLPFEVAGTGQARLKLSGPLVFNRLTYDLDVSFSWGSVGPESFDVLRFYVKADKGHVKSQDVMITKSKQATLRLVGQAQPNGQVEATVKGRQFFAEQLELLKQLGLHIAGRIHFDAQIGGHILRPSVQASGRLEQAVWGGQNVKDSQFKVQLQNKVLSGTVNLIDQVETRFRYAVGQAFYFYAKAQDFELTQVFNLFNPSTYITPYTMRSTAEVELHWADWKNTRLSLDLKKLNIQQSSSLMKLQKPARLLFQNGRLKADDFYITDGQSYISIQSNKGFLKGRRQVASLSAHIDMQMALFFTPFLDTLRGRLNTTLHLEEYKGEPYFRGQARVENALFKVKGFAHDFENIQAQVKVQHDTLHIQNMTGLLAQGALTGRGKIAFEKFKRMVVHLQGSLDKSQLEIPEGCYTQTSGQYILYGKGFPYTVGGEFKVQSGRIEQSITTAFIDDTKAQTQSLLPQFMFEQNKDPLRLNLRVRVIKPLPVRIRMPVLEMNSHITGLVHLKGPPEDPLFTGQVVLQQGGSLRVQTREFQITNGQVKFRQSPVYNPQLSLEAQARLNAPALPTANTGFASEASAPGGAIGARSAGYAAGGMSTSGFDVNLNIQGEAMEPQILATSTPPLPSHELMSLITLGFVPRRVRQGLNEGTYVRDTSLKVTSIYLSQELNRQLKNPLGVEFNFNIGIDNNNEELVNTVSLTKQWSPKLTTSFGRSFGGPIKTEYYTTQYEVQKNLFLNGTYESTTQAADLTKAQSVEKELGVNLEYKWEFE